MGGIEEAKQHIVKALRNKKHVVTANKDLMAVYGAELCNWRTIMIVIYVMRQV